MTRGLVIGMMLLCARATAAAQPEVVGQIAGGWDRGATAGTHFLPIGSGPAPVLRIQDGSSNSGAPHGDYNAPILQPWAADVVRQRVESDIAGEFLAEAKESCSPMGVPHVMQLSGPINILLTPDVAIIIYIRAMVARIVYLNEEHPADLQPTYYGHSVGHWEGSTLVVDAIGFDDETPIDLFGTPHTDQLHVVERYSTLNDGETLRVDFTVDDPGTFTSSWSSFAEYGQPREQGFTGIHPYGVAAPFTREVVCMENNRLPDGSLVPGNPTDFTPDF